MQLKVFKCCENNSLFTGQYTTGYYGTFKRGNSHYQKLWTHLDKKEKHALKATKSL